MFKACGLVLVGEKIIINYYILLKSVIKSLKLQETKNAAPSNSP